MPDGLIWRKNHCLICDHFWEDTRLWYVCPACEEKHDQRMAELREVHDGDLPPDVDRIKKAVPIGKRARPKTGAERMGRAGMASV